MIVSFTNYAVTLEMFEVNFYVYPRGRYNDELRRGHIGYIIITFGYIKHRTKLQMICDTIFIEGK